MKTLRIISYAGLVAVSIMRLVAMCAILLDSVISHLTHQQELTGNALSSPGSLDHSIQVGRPRFSTANLFQETRAFRSTTRS